MSTVSKIDPLGRHALSAALDQLGLDPPYELKCGFYWYIIVDKDGDEVLRVPRDNQGLADALFRMVSKVGLGCLS